MSINKKKIRREIMLNGEKVWITADTEQEYINKVLRLSGSINSSTGEKHNFREYAQKWFDVFSKPNVESVTATTYERQLTNHIYPVLGAMNLEDITSTDVQKIFNNMGDSAKQESKNKVKTVLNQIFKMALDDNLILRNPLLSSSIRIKGLAATETEPYTVEQMRHLASHLNDVKRPMDRAWLAISLSLPLRPEEVLGLQWADVDEETCTIHVRNTVTHPTRNEPEYKAYTKTASSIRDLKFPREILAYLPERGMPSEFVIGGEKPISYTKLRGIRKRVNLDTKFGETITPRRFRTTVATDISAMTHDLKLVQKSLGHATPQMTLKHYDKGRSGAIDASNAIGTCYGLSVN
ncbi:MAG: site-specific integrase [Succinivibrionaceae bacterium]|nr:site-specific integrase [Succinivibrionaceae bacterium]